MSRKAKWLILGAALLAAIVAAASPWAAGRDRALVAHVARLNGEWVGRRAPPFTLPDLDGGERSLAEFSGKVIFLNVWASFCAPCREEMPSMERLVRTYQDRGLAMLAVSVDPERADAARFMAEFLPGERSAMTVLLDPDSRVASAYGTELLPETYIIDRSGRVVARFVNAYDWTRPEVTELIEHLLADGPGSSRALL